MTKSNSENTVTPGYAVRIGYLEVRLNTEETAFSGRTASTKMQMDGAQRTYAFIEVCSGTQRRPCWVI
jgi:hypothetical protein